MTAEISRDLQQRIRHGTPSHPLGNRLSSPLFFKTPSDAEIRRAVNKSKDGVDGLFEFIIDNKYNSQDVKVSIGDVSEQRKQEIAAKFAIESYIYRHIVQKTDNQ